ncbi:MAG: ATP-binding protein [Bacteroidetes bacterium]|nr:ATP-binding protein [Bacteroidota bacterium]
MPTILDLGVEQDHIDSLTKANGITALAELIWNSLDADATVIKLDYQRDALGNFKFIKVTDNGHGLPFEKAKLVFGKLGGSDKKINHQSPKGRVYHGKEGRGRFKCMALGDLATFKTMYKNNGHYETYSIVLDRNDLSHAEISDLKQLPKGQGEQSFEVKINNVIQKNAEFGTKFENRFNLEEIFAPYWMNYQDFQIFFNGNELKFGSLIRDSYEKEVIYEISGIKTSFVIKVIEWTFENAKKTYLCNTKGIPYNTLNLGIRSSLPISMFIQSSYIEKLHSENLLDLGEYDNYINSVYDDAKKIGREYIRDRMHFYSLEFIQELKKNNLYPYVGEPQNIVEDSTRKVFDIVALQVHQYLPSFEDQDFKGKKLTLSLIKQALEKDSNALRKILKEVIELPQDKQDDLAELLECTSLSNIIDAMTEISNRITFLNGLEQLIYDSEASKNVKERRHLHKIIIDNTWIFGDEYTYGADDISLKNVLKEYLKYVGREDFKEIVNESDNSELTLIPDVCLWKQYNAGTLGHFNNLVIELKKPTVDAGIIEYGQIQLYANHVSIDQRFPKEKTNWRFLLVTRDIKPEFEPQLNQENREYGHVFASKNVDVFVLPWGRIINNARTKYQYLKEKLNLRIQSNEDGLNFLRSKYKEYLPDKGRGEVTETEINATK